jgi:hypothetical protein
MAAAAYRRLARARDKKADIGGAADAHESEINSYKRALAGHKEGDTKRKANLMAGLTRAYGDAIYYRNQAGSHLRASELSEELSRWMSDATLLHKEVAKK